MKKLKRLYSAEGRVAFRSQSGMLLLAALLAISCSSTLFGQSNQGSITGVVTDVSGAFVPNANITVKEAASGTQYNTISSSAGAYTFPNVRIGTYDITVEFAGFK